MGHGCSVPKQSTNPDPNLEGHGSKGISGRLERQETGGAGDMTQWLRAQTALLEDPGSTPSNSSSRVPNTFMQAKHQCI